MSHPDPRAFRQRGLRVHNRTNAEPAVVADARVLQHDGGRGHVAVRTDVASGQGRVRSNERPASDHHVERGPAASADRSDHASRKNDHALTDADRRARALDDDLMVDVASGADRDVPDDACRISHSSGGIDARRPSVSFEEHVIHTSPKEHGGAS